MTFKEIAHCEFLEGYSNAVSICKRYVEEFYAVEYRRPMIGLEVDTLEEVEAIVKHIKSTTSIEVLHVLRSDLWVTIDAIQDTYGEIHYVQDCDNNYNHNISVSSQRNINHIRDIFGDLDMVKFSENGIYIGIFDDTPPMKYYFDCVRILGAEVRIELRCSTNPKNFIENVKRIML